MNIYEEFSKLSDKDRKEVLDIMKYKRNLEKEKIKKLENIIEGLECDIKVLQEQIEDDCIAHEEANKWCKEAHELAIENKELQERINKVIEYINDNVAVYAFNNKELPHWEFNDDDIQDLLKILKGED